MKKHQTKAQLTNEVEASETERKRAEEEIRQRTAQLEALREVGLKLTAELDLDTLLYSIVSQAVELLEGTSGGLDLYRPERDLLEWTAAVGPNVAPVGTVIHRGEGISGKVWETGEPLSVDDYQHWEGRAASWEGIPVAAIMGTPVRWGGEFLGTLIVQTDSPRTFSPADAELLSLFATQAAIAIRNARLYEKAQTERGHLSTLYKVSRLLAGAPTLEEVAQATFQAAPYIGAQHGTLILLDVRDQPVLYSTVPDWTQFTPEQIRALAQRIITSGLEAWVLEHRQSTMSLDTKEDPRWLILPGHEEEDPIRSAICVPLLDRHDETLGVLLYAHTRPHAFSPEEQRLAEEIAARVTVALENARLYEDARRCTLEQKTLREAALALTTALDRNEVVERILAQLQQVVPYDSASVQLLREDRLEIVGGRGFPNLPDLLGISFPVGSDNPNSEVVHTRAPFIVEDAPAVYEGFRKDPHMQTLIRSWLGVPMLVGERMVGMIALDKREPAFYTQEHARLAEAFAAQAAIAMENSRLFYAEREQRELAKALEKAAASVSSTLESNEVLDRILGQVSRVVPSDAANIMLVEGDDARVARWRGYERFGAEEFVSTVAFRISDVPNLQQMMESKEPMVILDTATYPSWVHIPVQEWLRSYAGAPIVARGEVIGFLNVDSATPCFFNPHRAQTLQAFTSHVATAIENARIYAEEQRRAEEASTLLEIANAINSTLELDDILKKLTLHAARACDANRCTIVLLDERGETLLPITSQFASGRADPKMWRLFKHASYPRPVEDVPGAMQVMRERHPLFIHDAQASSLPRSWVEPFGVGSVLIVPLVSREQAIGIMALDRPEINRAFTSEQVNLAMAIGGQAAVAIENARLYREVLNHAEQLEQRVQERTAQLQAQYARLDAVLRSASDGIIVTDIRGQILQTNPVAQTWLTQTLSPEDTARLMEAVQDLALRAEERPETVLELTGLDLELKAAPISPLQPPPPTCGGGERWEQAAAVVAVNDVSHLKALDRMKTRFVSNVSHELRTPVTTIKLYAVLLQQTPPEAKKWGEYLDALAREADHQARLVEDILQISRIDTGRLEMQPRPTPLDELTGAATVSHQVLAQDRGLTLEPRPSPPAAGGAGGGGPVAMVDPERMMQVLNNLVGNAIRYTPEGGKVVVSTGREEAEGRVWATVTVSDTGIGIPEEELPHVFERFFRGEKPRLMQISGTGLGLAIVKEIVELHGGRVTVESPSTGSGQAPSTMLVLSEAEGLRTGEEGVGTTFTVWLPLAD